MAFNYLVWKTDTVPRLFFTTFVSALNPSPNSKKLSCHINKCVYLLKFIAYVLLKIGSSRRIKHVYRNICSACFFFSFCRTGDALTKTLKKDGNLGRVKARAELWDSLGAHEIKDKCVCAPKRSHNLTRETARVTVRRGSMFSCKGLSDIKEKTENCDTNLMQDENRGSQ